MKKIAISSMVFFLILSCKMSHKQEANEFFDRYYETLKHKEFDSVLSYYSESFFVGNNIRVEWKEQLRNIQKKFGNLNSYEIINYKEERTLQESTIEVVLLVLYDSIKVKESVELEFDNQVIKIKTHHIERYN